MTAAEQVRQALRQYAGQYGPASTAVGEVKSVNAGQLTCTVDDGNLLYHNVRLMPLLNVPQGQVLVPKAGSLCLMQRVEDGDDYYIAWASELQAFKVAANLARLELHDDGLLVARGIDGLREVLTDLMTEIQAIYAPKNVANLAAIQLRINNLLKPV